MTMLACAGVIAEISVKKLFDGGSYLAGDYNGVLVKWRRQRKEWKGLSRESNSRGRCDVLVKDVGCRSDRGGRSRMPYFASIL